jgi:hypothetical protein
MTWIISSPAFSPGRKVSCYKAISRWALKIVVGAREQGTLNREQEESFE